MKLKDPEVVRLFLLLTELYESRPVNLRGECYTTRNYLLRTIRLVDKSLDQYKTRIVSLPLVLGSGVLFENSSGNKLLSQKFANLTQIVYRLKKTQLEI